MKMKRAFVMLSMVVCATGVVSAQTIWDDYPGNPVLGPGDPGAWDAGGRMASSVVYDGSIWHMYYFNLAPDTGAIGHATSTDGGVTWDIDLANNPVLEPGDPGAWDEDAVWFPTVIYDGGTFYMWYTGVHGIYDEGGYATSPDGISWTKYIGNPVLHLGDSGSWDDRHARPGTVIADGATLKMWYTGVGLNGHAQIGFAESTDGITWTKHPVPVLEETTDPVWDQWVANPGVVMIGSKYYMLYAGGSAPSYWWRVGFALSSDGIHWHTYDNDNPVISVVGERTIASPVVFDGSTFHTWYGHYPPDLSTAATSCAISTGLFADGFETGDPSRWSNTVP